MKRNIAILGGTFDPIHGGHLEMARQAVLQYKLEECIFIPTGNSPHKSEKNITPASQRVEMIELAIQEENYFSISTMEIESNEISYTYRTLEKYHKIHPNHNISFIMGGDSIAYFKNWVHPEIICQHARLLVAFRNQIEEQEFDVSIQEVKELFSAEIGVIQMPEVPISSSEIRLHNIEQNELPNEILPKAVQEYIRKNHLYETKY